jgi:catechol 2,3-dioxygenase-like lactoylglutathione lyase family enzyme
VVTGVHAILYTTNPEADRAFFADVLGFESVDAGGGWLLFRLPPAELAAHPDPGGDRYELYLMCDDVVTTTRELRARGVEFVREITDEGWGLLTTIKLPGGGNLGLYEPRHPSPP